MYNSVCYYIAITSYLRHLIKREAVISSRSFGSSAKPTRWRIPPVSGCQTHPGMTRWQRGAGPCGAGFVWDWVCVGLALCGAGSVWGWISRVVTPQGSQALGITPTPYGMASVSGCSGREVGPQILYASGFQSSPGLECHRSSVLFRSSCPSQQLWLHRCHGNRHQALPCRSHLQLWPEVLM